MYKKSKIIAIIPARGGSKGIPQKNIKTLCGKPLIIWTIEQALNSDYIDEVYVSTEDKEIAEICKETGIKVIRRPQRFSRDNSTTESVLLHASKILDHKYDVMILLQCTSPLRYPWQIDEAIEKFFIKKADSLLSVGENHRFLWKNKKSLNYNYKKRPRRQEKEGEYFENGSFWIFKRKVLLKKKNRLGGKIIQYVMPNWMSFEIDELFDFELVEFLMKTKYKKDQNLKNIRLIIFDVDGVFTDGSVYSNEKGEEMLKFSRVDGKGIELLRLRKKYNLAIISSENSKIIKKRMKKLGIKEIHIGVKNKLKVYEELKKKFRIKDYEICYCGDDIQDLPLLKKAGFSFCPANANEKIKKACNFISSKKGGEGFVREICDLILKNDNISN